MLKKILLAMLLLMTAFAATSRADDPVEMTWEDYAFYLYDQSYSYGDLSWAYQDSFDLETEWGVQAGRYAGFECMMTKTDKDTYAELTKQMNDLLYAHYELYGRGCTDEVAGWDAIDTADADYESAAMACDPVPFWLSAVDGYWLGMSYLDGMTLYSDFIGEVSTSAWALLAEVEALLDTYE